MTDILEAVEATGNAVAHHLNKAAELLDQAWHHAYGDGGGPAIGQVCATMAHTHATIAAVMATMQATAANMELA